MNHFQTHLIVGHAMSDLRQGPGRHTVDRRGIVSCPPPPGAAPPPRHHL